MVRIRVISALTAAVLGVSALLPAGAAEQAAAFREGEHYERLPIPVDTRDPDKVEVLEVFSYGCIHCKNFQPVVDAWVEAKPEDVDFYRMPATFSEPWEVLAQLYYTAEALDVTPRVHEAIFRAIHDLGVNLTDTDLMAELFQREADVDPEQFRKVFSSFSVRSRVQQAHARGVAYRLSGTPTLIVDGMYRVDGRMAGGNAAMFQVADFLVAQRRAEVTGAN